MIQMQKALFTFFFIAIFAVTSCRGPENKNTPSKPPEINERKTTAPAGKIKPGISNSADSIPIRVILGDVAGRPEVRAVSERGLLKAAIPCDRADMCRRTEFSAAVGFEVELVRKIANRGFAVKENIVAPDAADADIRLAVPCGRSGSAPNLDDSDTKHPLAGPYLYRAGSGWLCIRVLRGGPVMATALTRIINHFYETGTFQQVYKNWFPPDAPDMTANP